MTTTIYSDGRQYDCLFGAVAISEDYLFYKRQVARYGQPVLELGCGTGRLTIPLAESGIQIVGIDIAETMLTVARDKAAERGTQVTFAQADMRDFALGQLFSFVFLPSNSMSHMHELKDVAACIACIRRHLTAAGRFAIDVFNPSPSILLRDGDRRYPVGEYVDDAGKRVVVTEDNRYDQATQINHIRWYYARDGEAQDIRPLDLRQFFPQELDALLTDHGFLIEAKYGDFAQTPFVSRAAQQLLVCCMR